MSISPRILILTPTALPSITGNAITTERWRRYLSAQGLSVQVLATQGLDVSALIQHLQDFKPDLLHVHHAYRAGGDLLNPFVEIVCARIPLVVSPGGTDIHADWMMEGRREIIAQVCRKARFLVSQSDEILFRLKELFPELRERVVFIPKSFSWMGNETFDLRGAAECNGGNLLFFFPAGIRPVKRNLECLRLLGSVHAERPHIRVVFAGAALDDAYAADFAKEVERLRAFARWIPPIAPQAIRSVYHAADIILNASYSEGLSNALLEATAAGRPILASKIPGNRWPVLGEDGNHPMGLLYDLDDPEDFLKKALILIDEREVRGKLGEAGKKRAARLPKPEEEAHHLSRVYAMALRES